MTDSPELVQLIQVKPTNLSDHDLLRISTCYFNPIKTNYEEDIKTQFGDFNNLNLKTSNIELIKKEFASVNWDTIVNGPIEKFPQTFLLTVYNIIRKYTKLKPSKRWCQSRNIIIVNRKIRRYNKKLLQDRNPTVTRRFESNIARLKDEKKKLLLVNQLNMESSAVNKIKSDPRYFYNYVKRFRKVNYTPNLIIDKDNEIITNPKLIANKLQEHFQSVFSSPCNMEDYKSQLLHFKPKFPLPPNLYLSKSDIIKAIDKMKNTSSCPRQDIPTNIFKIYKNFLWIPLQKFWTKSFSTGQIPIAYKTQTTIPIHKKGPKTNIENWRPISITPNPIKIFEIILKPKLTNYLEMNKLLTENQHGFRQKRSCSTQLLSFTDYIFNNLTSGKEVDCIYLDYSKAFDKVDHSLLLHKLKLLAIPDNYINWIKCFIRGRVQKVLVNNQFSFPVIVKSGVPQGSVLAPIFFNTFTNDLSNNITDCKILSFADDTKLISNINSSDDTKTLQTNLTSVFTWSNKNNMVLNPNKFELIQFKPTTSNNNLNLLRNLPHFELFFNYQLPGNKTLESSNHVKDLGIFIDCKLDWDVHIYNICKKARRTSGWILNSFATRERVPMMTLFNALIRPILEYNCEIWNPFKLKQIIELEKIQRSYTFRITGTNQLNYWERLQNLNIQSLQRRRESIIILNIWKIKNKQIPNTVNLTFKLHKRSKAIKAVLPPLPRTSASLLTKYEHSFAVNGSKLWNTLPPELTIIPTKSLFKISLNKYLEAVPDRPPVPGYSGSNNNSLLVVKPQSTQR